MRFGIFLAVLLCPAQQAWSWDERGHHVICEVATRLVTEEKLKAFLLARSHQLGHICNIPDIHWRMPGVAVSPGRNDRQGEWAHFMEPDAIGKKIEDLPLDLKAFLSLAPGNKMEKDVGTLWWRGLQFFNGAVESGKLAAKSSAPAKKEQQDPKHPLNRGIYDFVLNAGLLGHFVGDGAMPYHHHTDYDGWKRKRGGIHKYFEQASVDWQPGALSEELYQKALSVRASGELAKAAAKSRGIAADEADTYVLAKMKALSLLSAAEISRIDQIDPFTADSKIETDASGSELRTKAERPPPSRKVLKKNRFSQIVVAV